MNYPEAEPRGIRKELAAHHKLFCTLSLSPDSQHISLLPLHSHITQLYLHNTHLSRNYLPIILPLFQDAVETIVWLCYFSTSSLFLIPIGLEHFEPKNVHDLIHILFPQNSSRTFLKSQYKCLLISRLFLLLLPSAYTSMGS